MDECWSPQHDMCATSASSCSISVSSLSLDSVIAASSYDHIIVMLSYNHIVMNVYLWVNFPS